MVAAHAVLNVAYTMVAHQRQNPGTAVWLGASNGGASNGDARSVGGTRSGGVGGDGDGGDGGKSSGKRSGKGRQGQPPDTGKTAAGEVF